MEKVSPHEEQEARIISACRNGLINVVTEYVSKGGDVNLILDTKSYGKMTMLHTAAHFGTYNIAEYLLSNGADVNLVNEFMWVYHFVCNKYLKY